HINAYIEKHEFPCGFVMPNQAAEKPLTVAGWQTVGRLVTYLYFLNPDYQLRRVFRSSLLARMGGQAYVGVANFWLNRRCRSEISMETVSDFDEDFEILWRNYPKEKRIIRDRSVRVLRWRYKEQPGSHYRIGKFYFDKKFIGYIVWEE